MPLSTAHRTDPAAPRRGYPSPGAAILAFPERTPQHHPFPAESDATAPRPTADEAEIFAALLQGAVRL